MVIDKAETDRCISELFVVNTNGVEESTATCIEAHDSAACWFSDAERCSFRRCQRNTIRHRSNVEHGAKSNDSKLYDSCVTT